MTSASVRVIFITLHQFRTTQIDALQSTRLHGENQAVAA
jgi:hypothetical protein